MVALVLSVGRRLDRRPRHLGDAADELLRTAQAGVAQDGVMPATCAAQSRRTCAERASRRAVGRSLVRRARLAAVRLPARGLGGDGRRRRAACCTRPPARARPTRSGSARSRAPPRSACRCAARSAPPLGVLWLTPMRALAADSARAMQAPLDELGLSWSIGIRTGDTRAGRARAAGPALPDRARDDARIAQPDADARGARRTSSPACTPSSSTSGTS